MCDCLSTVNDKLAKDGTNTKISTLLCLTPDLSRMDAFPAIATEKADPKKREKPRSCRPTYCPFCGVKYDA